MDQIDDLREALEDQAKTQREGQQTGVADLGCPGATCTPLESSDARQPTLHAADEPSKTGSQGEGSPQQNQVEHKKGLVEQMTFQDFLQRQASESLMNGKHHGPSKL